MIRIEPFRKEHKDALLELTIAAWTPVFERTRREVPDFVYRSFYPTGWQNRQRSDVSSLLDSNQENTLVATENGRIVGFCAFQFHPEDQMGEIQIIAVLPDCQRRGVGRLLMEHAEERIRSAGLTMVMVETVGDSGHAPARSSYESRGYKPWPVARYFKDLRDQGAGSST